MIHARLALMLVAAVTACTAAPSGPRPGDVPVRSAQAPADTQTVPQSVGQMQLSFAPVVRAAAPAVVNIYTRTLVQRRRSLFADDPFFREFFGDAFRNLPGRRRIENSLGSGVIVDPAGIVVSNNHVVGEADEITVVLADKREFEAELIFADKESDLAVLRLDGAAGLPSLALRDSDTIEVGDLVLAIGNPFGVGQTVTSGIVSGLARSGRGRLSDGYFIQTDAAINPGNSGGALVDMQARLIGVNTAILSRSGGSNGIGFAVPANLVARVIDAAKEGAETLSRPWLGLEGQPVDGDLAAALGIGTPRGVLIDALHPESPLASAGLAPGDVIIDLGGDRVDSLSELDFRAATLGTDRAADVGFLRSGTRQDARLALAPAPEDPPRALTRIRRGALTGLTVLSVNPAVIEELDLSVSARGVLVAEARGPSRRVGLRPGDLLLEANGEPLTDTAGFLDELERSRGRVRLDVLRNGQRGTITVGG
ncbi:MAG: trypsin-like peptidase domain-containing protein [Pseudomonadota bacterium]